MTLENLGAAPIPGPEPAGQDSRYEPEYVEMQAEIDKLNSVTHIEEVDWKRVVELAGIILETKAKDVLAASYLSVGLMQNQGLEGLALGIRILKDMVATYWDECFPSKKRIRGRVNAFSWWQEKTLAWLRNVHGSPPMALESHIALLDDVKALDQTLGETLPDLPPMRELINTLQRLPVQRPPDPEPEKTMPADQQIVPPRAEPENRKPVVVEQNALTADTKPEDVKAARKALIQAALNYIESGRIDNPADPWVWKASRLAAWINARVLPPAQGGKTMIPAPEGDIKNALLTRLADGKYLEAAQSAENHFTGAIFWLDMHRIIAGALAQLGDDYTSALDAVKSEVGQLMSRLRGIEQLSFSDGTPFADQETRAWLASLTTGACDPRQDSGGAGQDMVRITLEQAGARFVKKDEAGALDIITQAMRQAPDGPSRMRLRLGQMDLLCRAGRFGMAAALADELLSEIQSRGLEEWDPLLSVQIFLAAREAYVGMGGEDHLAKSRALAARISRISPSAAMNLPF